MTAVCGAAIAAALTSLALQPGLAPAKKAQAAALPACSTHGLVIWLNTQGSGTAGAIYYRVQLTNLSARACTLVGYPRVTAVDLGGSRIGDGSMRFVSHKPTVVLRRGASASFVLEVIDIGNFPAARCRPVTAAGLRVFPPHSNASKVIPFPLRACSDAGVGFLAAQAVQPHP
jgi:hypothetical protein